MKTILFIAATMMMTPLYADRAEEGRQWVENSQREAREARERFERERQRQDDARARERAENDRLRQEDRIRRLEDSKWRDRE